MQKPGLFGMNGFMVFLLSCLSFAARAQQQGYLILLESENKQAFTVRLGDQFLTSTSHGHLVLSHLKDSVYRINIQFPKKNREELVFPVVIHQKDQGFQLKENDSVWVLYNWQTKETIHPVLEKDSSRMLDQGIKRVDGFSRLMAAVVNDSSVMYNTYSGTGFSNDSSKLKAGSQKLKTDIQFPSGTTVAVAPAIIPPAASRQPTAAVHPPAPVNTPPAVNPPEPVNPPPPTASVSSGQSRQPAVNAVPRIRKLREISLKISRKLVFLDTGEGGLTDTITLFVFFETSDTLSKKQWVTETAKGVKKPLKPDSTGVNDPEARNKLVSKAAESGCGQLATDADLEFLRSAILKANAEQDKISVAGSAFEQKCFSVKQIRLLAGLFVSDKARYRLMDAAHGHIADPDHFRELSDMYTDKNFQRKFLTLAGKGS